MSGEGRLRHEPESLPCSRQGTVGSMNHRGADETEYFRDSGEKPVCHGCIVPWNGIRRDALFAMT